MGAVCSHVSTEISYTGASHESAREQMPNWVYTAVVTGDPRDHEFGAMSSGWQILAPGQITRSRKFQTETDAAMWKQGFTSGKHVFEIHFPVPMRGIDAWVGVGLEDAELNAKGTNKVALVGHNKKSWGIGLKSRRAFHGGQVVKKYPRTMEYLPDKFYMYLDADSGVMQFGSDENYYGMAHEGMPRKDTNLLYPMVASNVPGATITMIYRGQATSNIISFGPPPPDATFNPYLAVLPPKPE